MKVINNGNMGINPALTIKALTQSGLRWAISPAQHVALESLALIAPVEIHTLATDDETMERLSVLPAMRTLCGIPSVIEDELPEGHIELRLGSEVLVRIEMLAIPYGMEKRIEFTGR